MWTQPSDIWRSGYEEQSMKKAGTIRALIGLLAFGTALNLDGLVWAQNVDYTGLESLYGEPVTTSATGKPQPVSKAPVSMDIVTDREIRASGAQDIPELLRRYAGVDVSRNFRDHADVNIRGYNQAYANRLLVLINGRQVYMDLFGMTLWNSFPVRMEEIKQIEIVRGPNTSLFGFNAASGVINIITYNPLYDNVGDVKLGYGSRGYNSLGGMKTFNVTQDASIRFSGERTGYDEFPHNHRINSARVPNAAAEDAFQKESLNLDSQIRLRENIYARLEAGYNQQIGDNLTVFNTARDVSTLSRHAKIDLTYDAGKSGVYDLMAYHNSTRITVGMGRFNTFPEFSVANRLTVLQASGLLSPHPDHSIRLSAEYRNNFGQGNALGRNDSDNFTIDTFSGAAMWDWRISDRWSMANSGRVDFWTSDRDFTLDTSNTKINLPSLELEPEGTEFSFNSGLVYEVDPKSSVRLSLGRGLHVPSIVELAFDENTSPFSELYGNPELDAEVNYTADLGYTRRFTEQSFSAGGNLIYQKIEDLIAPTVREFGPPGNLKADYTFENVGDSEAVFLELFAKGACLDESLNWNINYTYSLLADSETGIPDHRFNFEDAQPDHKINLALDYKKGPFELGTDVHFVSGFKYSTVTADFFDAYGQKDVSSYVVLNARAAYNFTEKTTLSLNGYNLAEEHEERPFFIQHPLIGRDGSNELGRTVVMALEHRF